MPSETRSLSIIELGGELYMAVAILHVIGIVVGNLKATVLLSSRQSSTIKVLTQLTRAYCLNMVFLTSMVLIISE